MAGRSFDHARCAHAAPGTTQGQAARTADTYRFAHSLPLRNGEDALAVNWCELTTTGPDGKVLYCNAWISNHAIHAGNVAALVEAGRARWKIENENNTTLKTQGYHLTHNFGHGKQHLSALLVTLNLLAFLLHTVLDRQWMPSTS